LRKIRKRPTPRFFADRLPAPRGRGAHRAGQAGSESAFAGRKGGAARLRMRPQKRLARNSASGAGLAILKDTRPLIEAE
jgi:hypothetical protein